MFYLFWIFSFESYIIFFKVYHQTYDILWKSSICWNDHFFNWLILDHTIVLYLNKSGLFLFIDRLL